MFICSVGLDEPIHVQLHALIVNLRSVLYKISVMLTTMHVYKAKRCVIVYRLLFTAGGSQ